jgi:hypothetical protein
MKKTTLVVAALFVASILFSQWSPNGTHIFNTNTGNVGIGVTNPTAKLELPNAGNASLRVGITSNRANTHTQLINSLAVIADNSTSVVTNGAVAWDFYNNGTSPSWAGTFMQHFGTGMTGNQYGVPAGNQGTLVFQNVSNGVIASNGANIFISPVGLVSTTFLTNGNVGIGTSSPGSFKLAVEGKIGAREVQVTNVNPWPDFVFKPEYKLPPLNEVEKFIGQYNHLPGVPSALEVKDGIELGKMNATLLQKVEELTLYLIELDKEIKSMKIENEILKLQVDSLTNFKK